MQPFKADQIVFLVGGKGTRLGDLTAATPKPLLEVEPGVAFLDVLLEEAARHGFSRALLLAGFCADQVAARYRDRRFGAMTVDIEAEPEPLGTAGGLRRAAGRLDPWFVLANGDSFFDINLRALAAPGASGPFEARLALRRVDDVSRYGAVACEGEVVRSFLEKTDQFAGPGDINAGIYLMSRAAIPAREGPASLERDVFPALARKGLLHARRFDGYFIDMGLPDTYARAQVEIPALRRRACVFFDRDGVLNVDAGYTHKPEDLRWIEGAREAVLAVNDSGRLAICVTNQAGVARGYYKEDEVRAFHAAMQRDLAEIGAHIDAFYFCPFHPDASIADYRHPDHPDRKPNPGMILRAAREWRVDMPRSILIGDMEHDVAAARAAGIEGRLYRGGDLRRLL